MKSLMTYRGYHAEVSFDPEDHVFVGEVTGITDMLVFHGTTVDELEEMFHQSIDNYLNMCKETGKIPDKEFTGTFFVEVTPELHGRLADDAAGSGVPFNQYISALLEQAVNS